MRTRVKICGITRVEDALVAVDAGADALGMVFYGPSPRNIELDKAAEIAAEVPAFITLVGLFVDAEVAAVHSVLDRVPIQLLQFHGKESPQYCAQFNLPYIKALRIGLDPGGLNGEALRNSIDSHSSACGILLDAYQKGVPGGTGERFDWDLIPEIDSPVILAGGLTPDNVAEAITCAKPYAVDVSGGVESTPRAKDADRICAFLNRARDADNALYTNN